MQETIVRLIEKTAGVSAVVLSEPMRNHTTFKIGGMADMLIEPKSAQEIIDVISILKSNEIPYFVMGNGSNLLVGDKGIRGAVIKISNSMSGCEVSDNIIKAEAGIKLSRLANTALKSELEGLEFASGIPGTLGGAIFMNAGAYGEEMKGIIADVTYIDTDREEIVTIPCDECEFGYRTSIFGKNNAIIVGATLRLKKGNPDAIRAKMNDLSARRTDKQPLDKPSAGSTFKRPEGYFAGALIQESGLMGCSVGGAEVSTKHAGFVINAGGATANDVASLIEKIQGVVEDKYGVRLEPEVKFVGEF